MLFWRRERAVLVGWLWFLGMLVPTIGLLQVGMQSMADRYTYLPQIGLFIAGVWGLGSLVALNNGACRRLALQYRCCGRDRCFRRMHRVSTALLAKQRDALSSCNERHGRQFIREHVGGDVFERAWGQRSRLYPYYIESLRIDPRNAEAHMNLANVLASRGQTQAAASMYKPPSSFRPTAQTHRTIWQISSCRWAGPRKRLASPSKSDRA